MKRKMADVLLYFKEVEMIMLIKNGKRYELNVDFSNGHKIGSTGNTVQHAFTNLKRGLK